MNDDDNPATRPAETGVWCAYYYDMSSVVPFPDELQALRYAVENQAQVRLVPWGEEVRG
jgi:hypothetical protein